MAQYISKYALVEEIERRKNEEVNYDEDSKSFASYVDQIHYSTLDSLEDFLDTLEVKEVDLEKALSDLDKDIKEFVTTEEFERESETCGHYWTIAKHAFLLGLKAQII